MTKREIASLACKILAIYAVIIALGSLQNSIAFLGTAFGTFGLPQTVGASLLWKAVVAFSPFVFQVSFGVFLWMFADGLAATMAKDTDTLPESTNLSLSDIQGVAFSIIGLMILVWAIPGVVRLILFLYDTIQNSLMAPSTREVSGVEFLALILQLAIGFRLLFGPRWIIGIIRAVSQAGLPDVNGEATHSESPTSNS